MGVLIRGMHARDSWFLMNSALPEGIPYIYITLYIFTSYSFYLKRAHAFLT